jgi:hypothetical protein
MQPLQPEAAAAGTMDVDPEPAAGMDIDPEPSTF